MRHFRLFLAFSLCITFSGTLSHSQEPQIINVENRESMTLNGVWKYIADPYQTGYYDYRLEVRDEQSNPSTAESLFLGYRRQSPSDRVEYDFEKADNILVPRDWNSQKEKLFYYEGSVWYYKAFDYPHEPGKNRQFIYFGAANYEADVYLNGEKLGKHVGGFTPFNFEVTGKLKPTGNFVILKVDNSRSVEKVPTINTDWWNYGGITRDVRIVEVPETFIQDYYIQLARGNSQEIEVWVTLNGPEKASQEIAVEIAGTKTAATLTTNSEGFAKAAIGVKKLKLWSPESPTLYEVKLSHKGHTMTDRIGFRTLETRGADILVNGDPVFLRGICIHEENGIRGGRAYSKEDARMLLGWAKELGCNFVRLAHYPHNENMTRVADELGIMVWSEVPVYWTIQWQNQETFSNAVGQMTDMITRDKNRASVIIWSMANETPVSPERTEFLKKMIGTANEMDPVRLISAALERHTREGTSNTQVVEDPLQAYVDIIAFNQYIGWYDGLPEKCKTASFDIKFDKPVVISEFGAGALQGLHGSKDERWTEEFQEYLFDETLKMLDKIPQLRGVTPWILADFRSPRRVLPDVQDGWNRKGLISETGEKKKAFYVLKAYYERKEAEYADSIILGVNAYSFADLLQARETRDNQQVFSLFNLLDWCADRGIKSLDPTAYFFPTYPGVPPDEYLEKFKNYAASLGIAISGTGIRNNFASPDPAIRAEGVELAKNWIVAASKMGAPVVRVFAGEIPEGYEDKWEEVAGWMIDCYRELIPYAQKFGVKIGIQNHGDMLQTAQQCIYVMKALDSKWAGLVVDTGSFKTEDPYADIAAVIPWAVNWQVKESVFGLGSDVRTDFGRLLSIVKEGGYSGYFPVETLLVRGKPYDPFALVTGMLEELETALAH